MFCCLFLFFVLQSDKFLVPPDQGRFVDAHLINFTAPAAASLVRMCKTKQQRKTKFHIVFRYFLKCECCFFFIRCAFTSSDTKLTSTLLWYFHIVLFCFVVLYSRQSLSRRRFCFVLLPVIIFVIISLTGQLAVASRSRPVPIRRPTKKRLSSRSNQVGTKFFEFSILKIVSYVENS